MKTSFLISLLCVTTLTHGFAQTFTLKSKDIGGQATEKQVFNGFGCSGANISPQLSWENPPEGTKSFAVTMYDPDAPTGSGWWHWLMFDIPATTRELPTNAGDVKQNLAPKGAIQSVTDFGTRGYGGPCPPPGHGRHQYIITVYALKVEKLGLDSTATPALVGFNLNANAIQKASIVMYYGR
ncbi:MAG TPA: YbhB/YbcL family Raf kinase inhibitor-like protein [Bacteroidota bacterium]|nr:YbhB/YbcL family Raf kinase inhibitor-like protein [Bacteroidota bacterium]